MHMRILYYTWFENSQEDMEETLIFLGNGVVKCNIPFELHRKGTNFIFPHWEQAYMAPPKEGSPQFIIFSMLSISTALGWSVY